MAKVTVEDLKLALDRIMKKHYEYMPSSARAKVESYVGKGMPYAFHIYEIGGVSGGSCWESSDPQHYLNTEEDPGFGILDKLLEDACPDISFLRYQKISKEVQTIYYTEYEYYGNQTDYTISFISLESLADLINKT